MSARSSPPHRAPCPLHYVPPALCVLCPSAVCPRCFSGLPLAFPARVRASPSIPLTSASLQASSDAFFLHWCFRFRCLAPLQTGSGRGRLPSGALPPARLKSCFRVTERTRRKIQGLLDPAKRTAPSLLFSSLPEGNSDLHFMSRSRSSKFFRLACPDVNSQSEQVEDLGSRPTHRRMSSNTRAVILSSSFLKVLSKSELLLLLSGHNISYSFTLF